MSTPAAIVRKLVFGAVLVACLLMPGIEVFGQYTIDYVGPVWQPATVHYHQIYQGSRWRWSPQLGWYRHDYYTEVPCWGGAIGYTTPPMPVRRTWNTATAEARG